MNYIPEKSAFKTHEEVLEALVNEVSLSATVLDKIQTRYEAIATHLDREGSSIKDFNPYVYPQGSINLGTANNPLNKDDDIDVDIVAELKDGSKDVFTQALLKKAVTNEVADYARQHNMAAPEDGKRCATLNYRDDDNGGYKFHVDILPAIPDHDGYRTMLKAASHTFNDSDVEGAIAITCKEHESYYDKSDNWPVSNPRGYAVWFESCQTVILKEQRDSLVKKGVSASVEDIPLFRVSTPLQKVIKLLKRDRDSTMGDDENKPISVIITTLAARAYKGEGDLVSAMRNILVGMDQHIDPNDDGEYYIPNPVNPSENFADRWANEPKKAERFFDWLRTVRATYADFLSESIEQSRVILSKSLSDDAFNNIAERFPVAAPAIKTRILQEGREAAQSPEVHKPWQNC